MQLTQASIDGEDATRFGARLYDAMRQQTLSEKAMAGLQPSNSLDMPMPPGDDVTRNRVASSTESLPPPPQQRNDENMQVPVLTRLNQGTVNSSQSHAEVPEAGQLTEKAGRDETPFGGESGPYSEQLDNCQQDLGKSEPCRDCSNPASTVHGDTRQLGLNAAVSIGLCQPPCITAPGSTELPPGAANSGSCHDASVMPQGSAGYEIVETKLTDGLATESRHVGVVSSLDWHHRADAVVAKPPNARVEGEGDDVVVLQQCVQRDAVLELPSGLPERMPSNAADVQSEERCYVEGDRPSGTLQQEPKSLKQSRQSLRTSLLEGFVDVQTNDEELLFFGEDSVVDASRELENDPIFQAHEQVVQEDARTQAGDHGSQHLEDANALVNAAQVDLRSAVANFDAKSNVRGSQEPERKTSRPCGWAATFDLVSSGDIFAKRNAVPKPPQLWSAKAKERGPLETAIDNKDDGRSTALSERNAEVANLARMQRFNNLRAQKHRAMEERRRLEKEHRAALRAGAFQDEENEMAPDDVKSAIRRATTNRNPSTAMPRSVPGARKISNKRNISNALGRCPSFFVARAHNLAGTNPSLPCWPALLDSAC